MGRKAGKYKKKESNGVVKKKSVRFDSDGEDMMNDEIDAFHKKRDIVPLNVHEDMKESDEDKDHPVFEFKDQDEDSEDEEIDDDKPERGLAAKIRRAQKYLHAKYGDLEDETLDDADEEEQEGAVWTRSKKDMYGADVDNEPQSTDDEDAALEEAEVLKEQRKKAEALSKEDFGLDDGEATIQEILDQGKSASKIKDDDGMACEIIEKDLDALTKEEQMAVVDSSAPELSGLLSELNDALEQLENKVNPLVEKIRVQESSKKGEMHYLEVKQLLLQSFCQAITFYLLLKSEGKSIRDHPVVSRLVEIKSLLDKVKELDDNLPFDLDEIVKREASIAPVMSLVEHPAALQSDSLVNSQINSMPSQNEAIVEPDKATKLYTLKNSKKNHEPPHKDQLQDDQVGPQSTEMLKIRASLEEKLKQRGIFSSIAPKNVKIRGHLQPANRQLETFDDFVDEALEIDGVAKDGNENASLSHSSKLSQHPSLHQNKRKVISGDDDLPKRDDVGERRRKYELRVLAGAGIEPIGDDDDEMGNLSSDGVDDVNEESDADSDFELYKQAEKQHAAKLAAKSNKYSRTPEESVLDTHVDGRRHTTAQIEKNRGLTRVRNKKNKNPRKKYRSKHEKAAKNRGGQVRAIRKPTGHYGGEASGINAGVSRSVRFKN